MGNGKERTWPWDRLRPDASETKILDQIREMRAEIGQLKQLQEKMEMIERLKKNLEHAKPCEKAITHLSNRVGDLESGKADHIPLTRTWTMVLSGFFAGSLLAGLFVAFHDTNSCLKFDYLAYTFPLMAGWLAGISLYNKRDVVIGFKASVALLAAGFTCYLQSKYLLKGVGMLMVGIGGLVASGLLAFVPGDKEETRWDKILKPSYKPAFVFWLFGAVFWVCFVVWSAHLPSTDESQCKSKPSAAVPANTPQ